MLYPLIFLERQQAIAFLTGIKDGKIPQKSQTENTTLKVVVETSTNAHVHSAAIVSSHKSLKKTDLFMIWIVLAVSLGIVFTLIAINYTIRRRVQKSNASDEFECNDASSESYTRLGFNQQHSQMQRILHSFNRLISRRQ